jgi:hypothetical protein
LLESRVNEVRDVIARLVAHPRRLAGDQRMLVGESDSYAGAIGRPDRDARIVAEALTVPAANAIVSRDNRQHTNAAT